MTNMSHASKPVLIAALAVATLALLTGVMLKSKSTPALGNANSLNTNVEHTAKDVPVIGTSALNATYVIDGTPVTLHDGKAVLAIGASTTTTQVFSVAALGDLNGDGAQDAAVILTQDAGGSGTFFYVAAAVTKGSTVEGSNAVLAGDRIAPDTTDIADGMISFNYAERAPGEPMTARPSVGQTMRLRLVDGVLTKQ